MFLNVQYPCVELQDGGQEFKQLGVPHVLDEGHLSGEGGRGAGEGHNLGCLEGGASRENVVKVSISLCGIVMYMYTICSMLSLSQVYLLFVFM